MLRALFCRCLTAALVVGLAGPALADVRRDGLRLAAATGVDAPAFLHDLLAAPILAGQPITDIRPATGRPAAGQQGVDFVFSCASDGLTQVVRAGLDGQGRVVSAELLLSAAPPAARRHRRGELLASALEHGARVHRLQWQRDDSEPAALILEHDGGAMRLGLSQFGRERLDCRR